MNLKNKTRSKVKKNQRKITLKKKEFLLKSKFLSERIY